MCTYNITLCDTLIEQARPAIGANTDISHQFLLRKHGPEGVRNLLSNLRQLVSVATSDEHIVDNAIVSQFKDFEDAMQYYTALHADAEVIITRNGKDFTASRIPVMNAAEYLSSTGIN